MPPFHTQHDATADNPTVIYRICRAPTPTHTLIHPHPRKHTHTPTHTLTHPHVHTHRHAHTRSTNTPHAEVHTRQHQHSHKLDGGNRRNFRSVVHRRAIKKRQRKSTHHQNTNTPTTTSTQIPTYQQANACTYRRMRTKTHTSTDRWCAHWYVRNIKHGDMLGRQERKKNLNKPPT